jgi:hypothetical protein
MKNFKCFLLLCVITCILNLSCKKEKNKSDDLSISTIGEIVSIFEIKYLETKSIDVGNQILNLTVKDLVDSVIVDCSLVDFGNNVDGPKKIRIHSYLQINGINSLLKVSSKPCGTLQYKNDGSDIQDITDRINQIKSISTNLNDNNKYYLQEFINLFDNGAAIEGTSFKIFLAKAFPLKYDKPNVSYSDYKFIFILTKIN